MSTENLEPVVSFVIEGKGWDGEEWNAGSGTPGEMAVFPESSEEGRALVEAARAYAVKKLDYFLMVAATVRGSLDFSVPNQPLEHEVRTVREALNKAAEFARVLCELAPWLYEDEDGEDDGEPGPSPRPAGSESA